MKRIDIKLSEGTQAHLEVLMEDLLKEMKGKGKKELKWMIGEAFIDGLVHCADLSVKAGYRTDANGR